MTTFQAEVTLAPPPEEVYAFCLSEQGFSSIMPNRITFLASAGPPAAPGAVYMFRWWMLNVLPITWVALIDHAVPGRSFADLQLRGVFRYFRHTHTCLPHDGGTRYRDTIEFTSGMGSTVDRFILLPQLRRTFRYRHRRMRQMLGAGA